MAFSLVVKDSLWPNDSTPCCPKPRSMLSALVASICRRREATPMRSLTCRTMGFFSASQVCTVLCTQACAKDQLWGLPHVTAWDGRHSGQLLTSKVHH